MDGLEIGIIGLGGMGQLYAKKFAEKGYKVFGCDLPEKHPSLKKQIPEVILLESPKEVSEQCDLIIYSVGTSGLKSALERGGPFTKKGAVVAGQTAVKTLEIELFERHLPDSTPILTCHSLHGPSTNPEGHILILIPHRCDRKTKEKIGSVFSVLGSKAIEIANYKDHDRMMADTQAVTHFGFMAMARAWKNAGIFPWEATSGAGGTDSVKILLMLRILGSQIHVCSDLLIQNPWAKKQIRQYALSESELFKMMIKEDGKGFKKRIETGRDAVFSTSSQLRKPLLNQRSLELLSLDGIGSKKLRANSHLSLLAMVDTWYQLGIHPYDHLVCQTPLYRLRLGLVEYLYTRKELLDETIETALFDKEIRGDDLEFHTAVREWASIVENEDFSGFKNYFEDLQTFFRKQIPEGVKKTDVFFNSPELLNA